jgi:hypothetical protein
MRYVGLPMAASLYPGCIVVERVQQCHRPPPRASFAPVGASAERFLAVSSGTTTQVLQKAETRQVERGSACFQGCAWEDSNLRPTA